MLVQGRTIEKYAMWVKIKEATTSAASGWVVVQRFFRNTGWNIIGLSRAGTYWKLTLFYLIRTHHSVRSFGWLWEIMRHKPQLGNPDRYKDNLHRDEPENLNNLYGCSAEMGYINLLSLLWITGWSKAWIMIVSWKPLPRVTLSCPQYLDSSFARRLKELLRHRNRLVQDATRMKKCRLNIFFRRRIVN